MNKKPFLCGFIFILLVTMTPSLGISQNTLFSQIKKTVVIDPGHGGDETGARGTDGTSEKNVTISFAKALKKSLEHSYNVTLTRNDDYDLDILSRTETANLVDADLFISFHTGASVIHERQGVGIYYYESQLGPNSSDSKKSSLRSEPQDKYAPISQAFARSLSNHLDSDSPHRSISIIGLPAAVLSGADMPAVLIELGYITSPVDEKLMMDQSHIDDMSHRIHVGITDFFNTYSK